MQRVFTIVTLIFTAVFASAQLPESQPLPSTVIPAVAVGGAEEKIIPVQGTKPQPTVPDSPGGGGVTSTTPRPAPSVSDPPTPTVQLQIRTPAHIANGKPTNYKLFVTNNSAATAYRVKVRVPIPDGVGAAPSKTEPVADKEIVPKELTWTFKSLARGEQKVIELEFKPDAGAKEIRLRGHVSFEHGAEVITTIDKPKLAIKKTATPTVSAGEPVTVRIEVVNSGTVPVAQTRLVETVPDGVEFKFDRDSEKGPTPNQRIWQLGTLEPGQAKIVTYQFLSKKGGELSATSFVANDDKNSQIATEEAVSKTKILVPALALELNGPEKVQSRESALYTATLKNTGTQTLENIRVNLTIPEDCEITKATNGYRKSKEIVQWILPKLPAGESFEYRLQLESSTSGKKVVKAVAKESRTAVEATKDVTSTFLGRAQLKWQPYEDDVVVNVGKQGQMTIKVKNIGTETEKAMRLRVELPSTVSFVQGSPMPVKLTGSEVIFDPRTLGPGQTEVYTITYEAKLAGTKPVRLTLEAESFNGKALTKDQSLQINNGSK